MKNIHQSLKNEIVYQSGDGATFTDSDKLSVISADMWLSRFIEDINKEDGQVIITFYSYGPYLWVDNISDDLQKRIRDDLKNYDTTVGVRLY